MSTSGSRSAAQSLSRRLLVQRVSLLVGANLFAPSAQIWVPGSAASSTESTELERAAARMLITNRQQGGYFTAQGMGFLAGFAMLLGAIAAICEILEFFGIGPKFNSRVQYEAAGGCRNSFQQAEYLARQNNLQTFNGVSRSPVDNNQIVLAATSQLPSENRQGAGILTTQYGSNQLVTLNGPEADIVQAGVTYMKNKHNLYGRQLALVSAVVGKTNRYSDGNPVRTYRTACGGFILHDCTPSNGQPYGQLCVHVPGLTEPGKLVPLTVKA